MAANPSETLLDRTYRLLDDRECTLREITEACPSIDMSWLAKFSRRAIPNPGVNLVQTLHDFLVTKVGDAQ